MARVKGSPTVSVIIPTYNRAHLVGRAIQSVLSQTYQDFEIIVVDDASTDNTEEVVKSFNDKRLRYVRLSENSGTSAAPRNTGIRAAKGEYIALLDSDDEWLPERLEKQVDKFRSVSSDVGVIYSGYVCITESVSGQSEPTLNESIPVERGDVFRSAVEGSLGMGDTTPLVRKECFQKVGVYDTEFLSCQSRDMWIRVSKHYKFDFVPEILCKYYIHGKQNEASLERRMQGLDRITRKYQDYLPKTLLSNRWQHLGTLSCYRGDFKKAGRYFREAIRENPGDIYIYIRFLVCKLAPRLYQARLRRLRAESISRSDRIPTW